MIDRDAMIRFDRLRMKTAAAIAYALSIDDCHKSYEGTWEVLTSFPDYFQDETGTADADFVEITLHCYVLGPHRHYKWQGPTFLDAVKKAETEVESWIEEQEEEKNNGIC